MKFIPIFGDCWKQVGNLRFRQRRVRSDAYAGKRQAIGQWRRVDNRAIYISRFARTEKPNGCGPSTDSGDMERFWEGNPWEDEQIVCARDAIAAEGRHHKSLHSSFCHHSKRAEERDVQHLYSELPEPDVLVGTVPAVRL